MSDVDTDATDEGRAADLGPAGDLGGRPDDGRAADIAVLSPALRTRVLSLDEADEARRAWERIAEARGGLPVMRDWPWTAAWLRHYGDVVRSSFLLVEDAAGAPHGVALLGRSRRWFGPVPIRTLWIGTANSPVGQEICAEFAPIPALPGHEAAVTRTVLDAARGMRGWDELRIDGVPGTETRELLAGWPPERVHTRVEPAPHFRLADLDAGADVASGLSGGARRRARASLRAMDAHGAVTVEWADERAHAEDVLAELTELHQARWTADGRPGLFAPGRFASVHRELMPELVDAGRAVLFRLRVDGRTIGCLYHLIDGDRLAFYQSGFARPEDNRLRPGLVTHLHCMDEARTRGFAVYDFLAGEARYKRDLSNGAGETWRIGLRRPRLRLRAYDAARRLRERLQDGDDDA
ncbi:GNAT family N-acetyltransferase [Patulibacter sp.]|uniref:GNAT family N-acetyltransferase n=1 Tax=Patulibacter sp. TaxID=1912859 RepID=UPI00271ACBC5|nr:GNAT family N-acetyltransferase [Patulibacter sp.]MDO9407227.1 GNAT family N-acetyltransferase [Patulibacter sp.]